MQEQNNGQRTGGSGKRKKIFLAVAAVLAAVALFFAGYFVYYLTLPAGVRSLMWVKDKIDSEYYENIDEDEFWDAVLDGAMSALDIYSAYYSADEYDVVVDSSRGIAEGLGLSFFSGTNMIAEAAYNSPAFYAQPMGEDAAWKTGLETGMFVTGAGDSPDSVQDTFTLVGSSGGNAVYSYSALSELIGDYKEGDTVYLRVSAESGHDTENCEIVPVVFARYTRSYVLYAADGDKDGTAQAYIYAYDENGRAEWKDVSEYVSADEKVSGDTAYIRLASFYGNAAEEFGRAAQAYKEDGMRTLLFDLRNNGGGSVNVMQGIAAYLMKDAKSDAEPVMIAEYGNGREEVYLAGGNDYGDYFEGSKIYVAGNRNTASASEALIGVMISYGTIGYGDIFVTELPGATQPARTYGKGIMQTTFQNPFTGEAVKLTTATIHWPDENRTCIHGKGISVSDGARASQGATTYGDYGDPELSRILEQIAV